jgi:hypothetical protein
LAIAKSYRKALWADKDVQLEVWVEKDALAGVILPITEGYDVPLMVTKGFCSETFAWESSEAHANSGKKVEILYLGDFDRSGQDAMNNLHTKLWEFAKQNGATVTYYNLGVTPEQIEVLMLEMDADSDGVIMFPEFLRGLKYAYAALAEKRATPIFRQEVEAVANLPEALEPTKKTEAEEDLQKVAQAARQSAKTAKLVGQLQQEVDDMLDEITAEQKKALEELDHAGQSEGK